VSPKVPRLISSAANVLVLIAFAPILIVAWPQIHALIGDGSVVAMALVVVLALAGGYFLGGPSLARRSTLGLAAAIRHPGIALALAGANHSDKPISAAVLLFMVVGIVVLIPYQIVLRRKLHVPADQG
ncbi:MAG TPA: Na+-dependent transporter, partial [Novosphingobium sp.]